MDTKSSITKATSSGSKRRAIIHMRLKAATVTRTSMDFSGRLAT